MLNLLTKNNIFLLSWNYTYVVDELRSNYTKFEAQRPFIYKNQIHLLIYQQTKTPFEGVF